MMNILNPFFEIFFPCLCASCKNRLNDSESHICINCITNIPKTHYLFERDNKLEILFAGRFPFTRIASFAYFTKEGVIQKITHEIKYKNNPKLAFFIGTLCGREIQESGALENIDLIVPIPLHPKRLKERGYNQSLLIAQGISSVTNKPVDDKTLVRRINNPSQTKKNKLERWNNTINIFGLNDSSSFEGKHILLIDDVITTGSTLEASAKTILQSANSEISIFSVGSVI